MTYSEINDAVIRLKKKYNEKDPFKLCSSMGIILLFQPMGKGAEAVKGFFLECNRIRTITVNSDLPIITSVVGSWKENGDLPINSIFSFSIMFNKILSIF